MSTKIIATITIVSNKVDAQRDSTAYGVELTSDNAYTASFNAEILDFSSLENQNSTIRIPVLKDDGYITYPYKSQIIGITTEQVSDGGGGSGNFTPDLEAKLNGIQALATQNSTDAQLRDRTTHTGVQQISSVTNLQTTLDTKELIGVAQGLINSLQGGNTTDTINSLKILASAAQTSTQVQAKVDAAITALINNSPTALDTLNEIAVALGNDPNFATTITNLIGTKVTAVSGKDLISTTEITRLANTITGTNSGDQDLSGLTPLSIYNAYVTSNNTAVSNNTNAISAVTTTANAAATQSAFSAYQTSNNNAVTANTNNIATVTTTANNATPLTVHNSYVTSNNTAVATAQSTATTAQTNLSNYQTSNDAAVSQKATQVGSKVLTDVNYSLSEQNKNSKSFTAFPRVGSVFHNPIPVGKFIAYQRQWSNGTDTEQTYQYWFKPAFNCTAVQLIFGNWTFGTTGGNCIEAFGLNPITINATLYCGGFRQLYFGNSLTTTLQPGSTSKTDPIAVQLTAGQSYAVRVHVLVSASGMKWPLGLLTQPTLTEGYSAGDTTLGGTLTTNTQAAGYHPFGIIAKPTSQRTYTSVGIFGDSIVDGNASGTPTGLNADQGWMRRGLDALNIPWVKFAIGGDTMATHMMANGLSLQLANSNGVDIALCNYGANDMQADLPTMQGLYLAYWNAIASQGMRVIQSTVLPRGSFTAGQLATRIAINNWIRTVPAPLSNYIEAADFVETARDSNVWKTGYSADNTHPTSAIEATLGAAAIQASMFLL